MKNQIVLWGKDEKEQDILVTLRLRVEDRKVDLWTFKKSDLKEEFVEKMFEDWKGIDPKEFPEPFTHTEREVSNSELLPETIKTTQTDLIIRAEKEWYFQVLAYQVFEQLKTELTAFSEQVKSLGTHSQDFWDEAVAFSNKIKDHAMARTLMRPQITELRKVLDNSFEHLKKLMSADRKDFDKEANENYDAVVAKLTEYRTRIENNENFKEIFDSLKGYQKDLKEVKLKMGQRKDIWGKTNEVFNLIKSKRGSQNSGRLDGRIAGLKKAIDRMEYSTNRDKKDLDFHKKQVEKAGSRMEVQLRGAKMQLLETTLNSKQEKLDDMVATLKDLEEKLAKSKEQQAKEAEAAKVAKAAAEAKEAEKKAEKPVNEIAASAEEKAADLVAENTEKAKETIEEGAEIAKTKAAEKTATILEKADETTAKVEASVDEKKAKIDEMIAKGEDKIAESIEGNDAVKSPAIEGIEDQLDKVDLKVDEVTAGEDDLKEVKSQAEEKLDAVSEKAEEMLGSAKETIEEKTGIDIDDLAEKGSAKLSEAKDKVTEVAENLKDTIEEKTGVSFESMEAKGEELLDDVADKVSGFFSALKGKAEEAFDSAHDYVAKKAEEAESEDKNEDTSSDTDEKKDA